MNEHLSAWMDGELSDKQARLLLSQLKLDAALRTNWDCYHLIRDALHGVHGPDLCVRIFARLDAEPSTDAPAVVALRAWQRHAFLNIDGSLLVRAGRDREGIDKLALAMRASEGGGSVYDWAFLALAHARLGQIPDAEKWLAKAQAGQAVGQLFWQECEVRLILDEVKSMIDGTPHR